jgi:hypothetical protein
VKGFEGLSKKIYAESGFLTSPCGRFVQGTPISPEASYACKPPTKGAEPQGHPADSKVAGVASSRQMVAL